VQAVTPLLLSGTDGVALDRPVQDGVVAAEGGPAASRDPSTGDVSLTEAATLVVTDATYADFSLTVHVGQGVAPVVRLGDAEFGARSCPWPAAPSAGAALELVRRGARITLGVGASSRECAGPPGRVPVALTAAGGVATIHSIEITRIA